ncbi:hypothetical protein [Salinarimonas ramus]|uniref:Uncharacterized protein n=1 Tax=Salinarimonas ramus TaxID=690164 RepID=A0A917Q5X4_9HYPH|nr:hypothetical protein [Salinarimonas ramus]GGK29591.1 hypothetical protein GCM10011322_14980 [Salinarimonas ramus]
MSSPTDTTSADDPARLASWWAALVEDLSPREIDRLRRMAEAFVGAQRDAVPSPAPSLLDLADAAHAARALAHGLVLAIEGLEPGEESAALGRIGDLLGREIAALEDGISRAHQKAG